MKLSTRLHDLVTRQISNDGGRTSSQEIYGPDLNHGDDVHMQPSWTCMPMCPVNKYDEDGNVTHYALMNILQMRDHLRYFHQEKGDVIYEPWVDQLLEPRCKKIEGGFNQLRKAQEEADAKELEKIRKEFGFA